MKEFLEFKEAKAVAESTDGLKVSFGGADAIWLPKSQIHDDSEVYKEGREGTLIIPKWLAKKHNLEKDGEDYGL